MKERPILFSGEMVRAILRGEKTQTRREMNPQPEHAQVYDWKGRRLYDGEARHWCWKGHVAEDSWDSISTTLAPLCPLGQPGDRLWVRETYALSQVWDESRAGEMPMIVGDVVPAWYRADEGGGRFDERDRGRWRPSIHMPRWASRLTLEIASVRVERLADISEEDARTEGVTAAPFCKAGRPVGQEHVEAFEDLWRSINGAESWDANPWVWVVGFKRIETEAAR